MGAPIAHCLKKKEEKKERKEKEASTQVAHVYQAQTPEHKTPKLPPKAFRLLGFKVSARRLGATPWGSGDHSPGLVYWCLGKKKPSAFPPPALPRRPRLPDVRRREIVQSPNACRGGDAPRWEKRTPWLGPEWEPRPSRPSFTAGKNTGPTARTQPVELLSHLPNESRCFQSPPLVPDPRAGSSRSSANHVRS